MMRQIMLFAFAASCAAFAPRAPLAAASRSASSAVQMNTQYTEAAGVAKKKNSLTGDSAQLKGYTVGSRAPKASVSSGSKAQFGYGIDNLYGGKVAQKSEPDLKGKIDADAGSYLSTIGTAWLGLVGLYVLSLIAGDTGM